MNPKTILALIEIALMLSKRIPELIQALKQTGELSPQQEADLDALIASLKDKPHWQVEKKEP